MGIEWLHLRNGRAAVCRRRKRQMPRMVGVIDAQSRRNREECLESVFDVGMMTTLVQLGAQRHRGDEAANALLVRDVWS